MKRENGFTVLEIIVGISVVAILAAVLAPVLIGFVHQARIARAYADVKTLVSAVFLFEKDLGRYPVQKDMSNPRYYYLLFTGLSESGVPSETLLLKNENGEEQQLPDEISKDRVDNIHLHFIERGHGYPKKEKGKKNASSGWDGAYVDSNRTDPWGNPYLLYLRPLWDTEHNEKVEESNIGEHAVVFSLGPNKTIESEIGSSTFLGDDIGIIIK